MKPVQCRAARILVGIAQTTLAAEAKVSERTVTDFERGERRPQSATLQAIASALERLGVELIGENGRGVGARVRARGGEHQPKPKKGAAEGAPTASMRTCAGASPGQLV